MSNITFNIYHKYTFYIFPLLYFLSLFPYISHFLSLSLGFISAENTLSHSHFRHSLSLYTTHTNLHLLLHISAEIEGESGKESPEAFGHPFLFFFSSFLALKCCIFMFSRWWFVIRGEGEVELKKKVLRDFPKPRNEGMLVGFCCFVEGRCGVWLKLEKGTLNLTWVGVLWS